MSTAKNLGILTFDREDPHQEEQFRAASQASSWVIAMNDLDQALRQWQRYHHSFITADEAIDAAREALHGILKVAGLDLEVLS